MKFSLLFFCLISLSFSTSFAKIKTQIADFDPAQVSFDFLSSDGSFWYDCTHKRGEASHAWIVQCDRFQFNLHLFLDQSVREQESIYEFHFWADEVNVLNETHTQSTWLTVDNKAVTKKIVSYLGFQKDASQLRIEVQLK